MSIPIDHMLILQIARYYYVEHYSQQKIAELLKIDRSQISRYLKFARDNDYVKIDISLPDSANKEIYSKHIEHSLGLEHVLVAPTKNLDENARNDALYIFTANYLEKKLQSSHKIGIGWGQTLYNISLRLSTKNTKSPRLFCSLTGLSGIRNPFIQTNSITDRFANCFGGEAYYNNFLCYMRTETLSSLDRQRLNELQSIWTQLDTVVMSLGGSIQIENPYLAELPKEINLHDLVNTMQGDILGNFFLSNHDCYQFPDAYTIPAMQLNILPSIPNVICIAAGDKKVKAIISAARQGYIKTLVTDETTCKLIFDTLQKE